MAKSSAKPLPRWMSAKRDCREARFVQIGNSLLFHEKFRSLSAGAFKLYICCAMEAAGSINFQIPASKAEQYGIPPRSLARYIKELEGAGFIQTDRSRKSTRTANDYSFCFRWLDDG
nr:MAG TPA: replication initiator protein [Caudoviricetes sp.]